MRWLKVCLRTNILTFAIYDSKKAFANFLNFSRNYVEFNNICFSRNEIVSRFFHDLSQFEYCFDFTSIIFDIL